VVSQIEKEFAYKELNTQYISEDNAIIRSSMIPSFVIVPSLGDVVFGSK
jgi:hypothetical protein